MKKERAKVEIKYELQMWQLLLAFVVALIAASAIGTFVGHTFGYNLGYERGVNAVEIRVPEYCSVEGEGSISPQIVCAELQDVTLDDLCAYVSPKMASKIRILMVA